MADSRHVQRLSHTVLVFTPLGGSVLNSYSVGKKTLSKISGLRSGSRRSRPG